MGRELYGISGYKHHGKDTFARLIQGENSSFEIAHFAGTLKTLAVRIFPVTKAQLYDQVLKEQALERPIELDQYLEPMRIHTGLDIQPAFKVATTPRELMQFFGTEYVRKAREDYWIWRLVQETAGLERVLVPDTRFPNEADAILGAGGKIIKIERVDLVEFHDAHASETEVDRIVADLVVGARTGDLSLPTLIASLVAHGEFDLARRYDYRACKEAIDAYLSDVGLGNAAALLSGSGDKDDAFAVILSYYRVARKEPDPWSDVSGK